MCKQAYVYRFLTSTDVGPKNDIGLWTKVPRTVCLKAGN